MRFCLLFCVALLAACGHSHDDYATFQACFDEHTDVEGYAPPMAITICALDHGIEGETLDFTTAAECIAYVEANLAEGEATSAEIMAGCEDYIVQKDQ